MPQIRQKAENLTSRTSPADYASAIMDLGAVICTPRKPQCLLCPWQNFCRSKNCPELEEIPVRTKPEKKEKQGSVCLIYNSKGEIFIRKRTEKGLLSGLYEFPWSDNGQIFASLNPQDSGKTVTHVFTHFKLLLRIYILTAETPPLDGQFVRPQDLENYPISTLMKKVYAQN